MINFEFTIFFFQCESDSTTTLSDFSKAEIADTAAKVVSAHGFPNVNAVAAAATVDAVGGEQSYASSFNVKSVKFVESNTTVRNNNREDEPPVLVNEKEHVTEMKNQCGEAERKSDQTSASTCSPVRASYMFELQKTKIFFKKFIKFVQNYQKFFRKYYPKNVCKFVPFFFFKT